MRRFLSALRCGNISSVPTSSCCFGSGPRRSFTEAASDPANKVHVYLSRSHEPVVNLAFENRLLETLAPTSTALLLYVNEPCVVIGRNQNAWLEADLAELTRLGIELVRRRSGGGTVFHDLGNVNYSVVCPTAAFDRDRHADMVARALASLGRRTRVNGRHDIVIDDGDVSPFKVSGSAYKVTRLRALHHGTCLLRSPNLARISGLLRSPAESFIKARGVESVRSRVANLDLGNEEFEAAVVDQFRCMHDGRCDVREVFTTADVLSIDGMADTCREMKSADWVFGQTPLFTLSTYSTDNDARPRPPLPFEDGELRMQFVARHGKIERFDVEVQGRAMDADRLVGHVIHEIARWSEPLTKIGLDRQLALKAGSWLDEILGVVYMKQASQQRAHGGQQI